jgi:DNA-binding NarL/FixJ family response regulator
MLLAEELVGKQTHVTVALADDFILLREGLAAICELSGIYHVAAQCADGRSALEALIETDPDIAVVDFKLPELAALDLLAEIRLLGLRTRVLVMADQRDRKIAVEVLRAGGRGVLLESDTSREVLLAFEQVAGGGVYLSPAFSLSEVFAWQEPVQDEADPLERLSSREYQVFSLLVEGVRAKDIASRLHLSPKTVDTYRASLMKKLDIRHVAGLVRFSMDRELKSPGGHSPGHADSGRLSGGASGTTSYRSACTGTPETSWIPESPPRALSAASAGGISNRTQGKSNPLRLSH